MSRFENASDKKLIRLWEMKKDLGCFEPISRSSEMEQIANRLAKRDLLAEV